MRTSEAVPGASEAGGAVIFFLGCCAIITIALLAAITAHEIAWRLGRRGRKGWL